MTFLESIILGIIQGATEFLPVSSSGHLIVIPKILNISQGGLSFDAVLHIATGLALVSFFLNDWKKLTAGIIKKNKADLDLAKKIVVGSIPAGVAGLVFNSYIESFLRKDIVVAVSLIAVALLMIAVEKLYVGGKKDTPSLWDSALIGVAQAIALIPGVSRSGITIICGMILGLKREEAARFSFLMATPIVLAAGLYELYKILPLLTTKMVIPYIVGFIAAFFSGLFAIEFLLSYIKTKPLKVFALYRVILASLVIVVMFL